MSTLSSQPLSSDQKRPRFQAVNPADNQPGRAYSGHTVDEAHAIVADVRRAFEQWRRTSFAERARVIKSVAAALRRRRDEFAGLMAAEMGKPVGDGNAEIEKCAFNSDYFAEHASRFLADKSIDIGGGPAFVTYNPLGVVLAIMPWNFPFWQVFRFAAPSLMAGNAIVLKHASSVPGCALAIEQLFRDAGLPENVFRTVLIVGENVESLIGDPHVAAVTLTGSVEAGRKVAATAGAALKKSVLELGGADAYLVLEDADIEQAAAVCAAARMVNGGQSCIAGKRFIVVASIRQAFEQAFTARMQCYAMGDPRDPKTMLGPMCSVKARDTIHRQVQDSVNRGARILTGGIVPDRAGAWYPPTILTDVRPGMPAHDEEVFGPVAAIIEARDEVDAIRIANASSFGLGSAVITKNGERGQRIAAQELESGMSFINDNVRSDPRLPFGGVKNSGYGRECSEFGIREFVNIKTVVAK
jgi:succinate-semialdehyde dehydrogenase/glutarate-semialdehyde dehydrogenase